MNQRHAHIVRLLTHSGEMSVRELAKRFSVSLMTIRRDLTVLERRGRVMRTHGGAVLTRIGNIEFAFYDRARMHTAEKYAIALQAAQLIEPDSTVCLDTGTTTLEVAHAIAGIRGLTVFTSSLVIASALYTKENIEVILLGGTVRKGMPDLSGALTEDNLRRFRIDTAVLGADGVFEKGLYAADARVARVSRTMIDNAVSRVVVVDSSKFGETALVQFSGWENIDVVVTDEHLAPKLRKWLDKTVKKVIYANVGGHSWEMDQG